MFKKFKQEIDKQISRINNNEEISGEGKLEDDRIEEIKELERQLVEKKQRVLELEKDKKAALEEFPIVSFMSKHMRRSWQTLIDDEEEVLSIMPKVFDDPLYEDVKTFVIREQKASTSLIQRSFGIGYDRAARIIDALEIREVIGAMRGSKPREVYISESGITNSKNFVSADDAELNIEKINNEIDRYNDKAVNLLKSINQIDNNKYDFLRDIDTAIFAQFEELVFPENFDLSYNGELDFYERSLEEIIETSVSGFLKMKEYITKGYVVTYKYIDTMEKLQSILHLPVISDKTIIRNNLLDTPNRKEISEIIDDLDFIFNIYNGDLKGISNETSVYKIIVESFNTIFIEPSAFEDIENGYQFEEFIAELLRENGYEHVEITPAGGDYGVDLIARKNKVIYAVQCKFYSTPVGNSAIQEVYSGMDQYNAHVGIVVTNNYFTPAAKKQAESSKVVLWDYNDLKRFL